MKSRLIFSSIVTLSILFSSCKKEEEATADADGTPKEIIMPRVQEIPSGSFVQPNNQNVPPVQSQTITPTNQTAAVTKAGMNPAHGQPGHRCDISVGAPLNSPVAKPANPGNATIQPTTISSNSTTTTSTPAAASTPAILNSGSTVTAAGMNPPHGETGHVCGIAVGSPLPTK